MTRPLAAAALVLAALPGCAYLEPFLRSAFQEPALRFRGVSLTDVSLGGLGLDTVWDLDNPNAVGVSLAAVDYALFIDGKQVVAGAPPRGLQVPPRGTTQLHFPAGIRFADVVGVVETFLTKDLASWRAEGSLGVETPIGVLRFPIAKEGQFEVPKLPAVAFGNPRVTALTLQGATVEFPLTVTNRNSYPLPVAGLTGSLSVAGSPIGTLSTGDLGALEGKGARQVSLPLTINFFSAAGAVVNAVRGGQAPVTLDARVQSGPQALPLRVDQLVNFVR